MSTRRMNVIDAKELTSGTDSKGRAWTIYDITAVTLEGVPIEEKLKSFARLTGEVEVEVERQEHEKYGVSYMLKSGQTGGSRLGPKVDELRAKLDDLQGSANRLHERVSELERLSRGGAPAP